MERMTSFLSLFPHEGEKLILSVLQYYYRGAHAQSHPTLCDPMDCSPPGSSVHGILQQEYWSGLPCPSPGDLPNSGIKPRSSALLADSLLLSHLEEKPLEKVFRERGPPE